VPINLDARDVICMMIVGLRLTSIDSTALSWSRAGG